MTGKRALITGGAQGIGRAIAMALAREGCDVALIDVDAAASQATLAEIHLLGRAETAAAADVSDPASVRAGISALTTSASPFEILINNAGIAALGFSARN